MIERCPVTANPSQCERERGHAGPHGVTVDGNWCIWTNPVVTEFLAQKFSDIGRGLCGPATNEELAR